MHMITNWRMAGAAASIALAAAVSAQDAVAQQVPGKEVYRGRALTREGDAARGRERFQQMTCAQCHTVDGSGRLAGPDLSAIGDKFRREDLVMSVLDPSSAIAVGYDSTVVTRKDGTMAAGVIKQATEGWIELKGAGEGSATRVEMADIAERATSPVSLMPEGLHAMTDPEGFTDLIAYLTSLRPRAPGDRAEDVAKASIPATFDSFFGENVILEEPVWFGELPGREHVYVVLEHRGRAWIIDKTPEGDGLVPFLDLREVVRAGGATGLLSMAFHPKFPRDLRYFLKYQIVEAGKISTLVMEQRFKADLSGDSGEPGRMLMKIPATTQDHNGGCIAFGPDGFLYIGMGDTGPQRDPQGHGQDRGLLLGKMLRIDVDHRDGDQPYAIPADNPFVGQKGTRPEIWALGFREPWRFSWDSKTGDLWVGDVGQDRFEEVSIVRKGENHGWNVIEGFTPFSEKYRQPGETLVPPVWSYSRRFGDSVTGGYVYHGALAPALQGAYIFGDHDSRRIFAVWQQDRKMTRVVEIGQAPSRAVSFGQTKDGELFVLGFNSGKVYHLGLDAVDPEPPVAVVLAATAEAAPVDMRFTLQEPAEGWAAADFDDVGWQLSQAGFGSSGTPGAVVRTQWRTDDIWLRREFSLSSVPDAKDGSRLVLRIHHDEDAEVYLNGVRVSRLPRWTQAYEDVVLGEEALKALRTGRNVLAIHCHQNGGGQYIDAGLLEYRKR